MGRVTYFEILADDPERASAFYKNAFGWHVKTWSGGEQTYWMVSTGETGQGINGGIMGRNLEQAVINTIQVDSLEDALAAVDEHGGLLVHGPKEVPNVGMHAYCKDTEGNLFGLLEPK